MKFELVKNSGEYFIRTYHNDKQIYFNEKLNLSPKDKSLYNVLKKFPHFFGEFKIKDVPILDFLDEVEYQNKVYKINHSFHTLTFDFNEFYLKAVHDPLKSRTKKSCYIKSSKHTRMLCPQRSDLPVSMPEFAPAGVHGVTTHTALP